MLSFEHTILHITREGYERPFNVIFSYDENTDTIIKEELSGNWKALDDCLINQVIRYAIIEQKVLEYTLGEGNDVEFTYPIERFYETIGGKSNATPTTIDDSTFMGKVEVMTRKITFGTPLFRK